MMGWLNKIGSFFIMLLCESEESGVGETEIAPVKCASLLFAQISRGKEGGEKEDSEI